MGNHRIMVRSAKENDIDFVYQSLMDMLVEERMVERFSQTKETLKNALFSQNRFAEAVIAEFDDFSVGLCLFSNTNRNFNLFTGPGIYVHDIYVHPDYRRMNIATTLAKNIIKIAKDRNCDRIDGVIIKSNVQGQQFYKSLSEVKVVDYIDYVRAKL